MTLSQAEYELVLRTDLMSFIQRAFYELNPELNFLPSPHIEVIASRLEACIRGQVRRLIICLPPRSLKSVCASVAFPAWYLGHYPSRHVICASYGQELADKFARDSRRIMQTAWYKRVFSTRLSDRQAVYDFATTQLGTRLATSVGGVLTGRGADLIIIDDPIKPDDALSESRRGDANNWYSSSVLSRLNDKAAGCVIVIMQRLHQDDLVGHLMEQGDWELLSFPAIAEEHEVHLIENCLGSRQFVRRRGDALQPERESLETLEKIRRTLGEYHFSSQYQQDPTPLEGNMIKHNWLKFYTPGEQPRRFWRIIQSWDTANKSSELSDYSVCTTWGVIDNYFYLLHVYRGRLNYPELKRQIVDHAKMHKATSIVIEDKASGTQLIQELKRDWVQAISPYEPPAGMDKIMRLHAQSAVFENGRVFIPSAAPWLADYLQELTSFPGAKYDDQVDSTTQALAYMQSTAGLEIWARL